MQTKSCPKCGQEIPSEAEDCPYCGIVLAKFQPDGAATSSSEPGAAEATGGGSRAPDTAGSGMPRSPTAPAGHGAGGGAGLYDPDTSPQPFSGAGDGDAAWSSHGPVTDTMIEHLSDTGPWVTFMAVLTLLSAVLMAFVAVFGMGVAGQTGVPAIALFFSYSLIGVLYLVFALQLLNFGRAARQVREGGGTPSIEEALRYQLSFWRLLGIVTLIWLGLAVLGIVAAILIPLLLSAGGAPGT